MLKGFCLQQEGDKRLQNVLYCKTNLLHAMTALKGLNLYTVSCSGCGYLNDAILKQSQKWCLFRLGFSHYNSAQEFTANRTTSDKVPPTRFTRSSQSELRNNSQHYRHYTTAFSKSFSSPVSKNKSFVIMR